MVAIGCSESLQEEPIKDPLAGSARNLLLICIDTVRADIFYGLGDAQKDSFSAWQDRALVFEQAMSTSSWTVPAIGSVFSGLWALEHGAGRFQGVTASMGLGKDWPSAMYKDVPRFPQIAKEEGFNTAVISASGWTNYKPYGMGLIRGFDDVFRFKKGAWQPMLAKLEELIALQRKNVPNLYFLHLMEAHNWHVSPETELDSFLGEISAEKRALYLQVAPPQACEDEQSVICKRYLVYASAVSALREAIATTLETMEKQKLLDDTAVIVFSDHGEEFDDHADDERITMLEVDLPGITYAGHGHSMYQELLHVPLMVWHPQHKGWLIKQPVSLVDIGPTAARWLDLEFSPARWPGQYLDSHASPSQKPVERALYASGISSGGQQVSVQQDTKKSIWYMALDQNDYYDLEKDPYELNSSPTDKLVLLFDGLLLDYMETSPVKTAEPLMLSDEQIRDLQSIGYLQGVEGSEESMTE